jgi:hypothetical protein
VASTYLLRSALESLERDVDDDDVVFFDDDDGVDF